jgi:hypothetical protein
MYNSSCNSIFSDNTNGVPVYDNPELDSGSSVVVTRGYDLSAATAFNLRIASCARNTAPMCHANDKDSIEMATRSHEPPALQCTPGPNQCHQYICSVGISSTSGHPFVWRCASSLSTTLRTGREILLSRLHYCKARDDSLIDLQNFHWEHHSVRTPSEYDAIINNEERYYRDKIQNQRT